MVIALQVAIVTFSFALASCSAAPQATTVETSILKSVVTTTATAPPIIKMSTVTVTKTVTTSPEPSAEPESVQPSDLEITLEVTEKQCFGSAGCNVTVEPTLTPNTLAAIAGGYRVTYEISGDQDGPVIETLSVDTDGTYSYETSTISTASKNIVPKATVTSVRPIL
jgi:hypothetical protein